MRVVMEPEMSKMDVSTIHKWLNLKGWVKTTEHPFSYQKPDLESEKELKVMGISVSIDPGTIMPNIFAAMIDEMKEELEKNEHEV